MRDDRQSAGDDERSPRRNDDDPANDQPFSRDGDRTAGNPPVGDVPAETASDSESRLGGQGGATATDQRGPAGPSRTNQSDGPGWVLYVWDLLSSVAIVVLIGALLFTASGIWPPMVAVESGSMEPVLERGDLVYVMESERFPGPGANENGVVTYQAGKKTDYKTFGDYGDVIVFEPNGDSQRTPTIHRPMMWVEEGENWVQRANPQYLGSIDSCSEAAACPAEYEGYITKGDSNGAYDQTTAGLGYDIIRPEWVVGTAEVSVPYLGSIRLGAVGGEEINATGE